MTGVCRQLKFLLVGNHTCGNRGDGAILRGLLESLRAVEPTVEIDTISCYPTSSSFFLGESLAPDTLYQYHNRKAGKFDKLWKSLGRKAIPHMLHLAVLGRWKGRLPRHINAHINTLKQYDAVIQVGGSFFVDLYGETQFEHALCAFLANKPVYMLGHSVGPFQLPHFNSIAKTVFAQSNILSLREGVSLSLLKEAGLPCEKVHAGADTAWLVPPHKADVSGALLERIKTKPAVAITLRELAPFDKRLGISQQDYECAFAKLADSLISAGYQVIAFSTCTGIESYHKDDRMVALRLADQMQAKESYHVVMDELNDIELGTLLGHCILTVSTRLHGAIISMNFDTPAIALNYEHKSEGIMIQLGLPHYSNSICSLFDGRLEKTIFDLLKNIDHERSLVASCVNSERERARSMITTALSEVRRSI